MKIHTTQCFACDGEGIVPSKAYNQWQNAPEDPPSLMCFVCNGDGNVFYLDGEKEMFSSLADRWEQETCHISSVDDMIKHPCYQTLKKIGGKKVVVFILKRIAKKTTLLMVLLSDLIKKEHSPITEQMRGKIKEMSFTWVKWGVQKGYISKEYESMRIETAKKEK